VPGTESVEFFAASPLTTSLSLASLMIPTNVALIANIRSAMLMNQFWEIHSFAWDLPINTGQIPG